MAAAAILKNRKISICTQPIDRFLTKFGSVSTLSAPITNKISLFQKSKMAAAAILKIRKIAISPTTRQLILTIFSKMMSLGLPDTVCQ